MRNSTVNSRFMPNFKIFRTRLKMHLFRSKTAIAKIDRGQKISHDFFLGLLNREFTVFTFLVVFLMYSFCKERSKRTTVLLLFHV